MTITNFFYIFTTLLNISAIRCPSINNPPLNGEFRNPPQATYGSIVAIDCDKGYFLTGKNILRCIDVDNDGVGEWDKQVPNCRGKFDIVKMLLDIGQMVAPRHNIGEIQLLLLWSAVKLVNHC